MNTLNYHIFRCDFKLINSFDFYYCNFKIGVFYKENDRPNKISNKMNSLFGTFQRYFYQDFKNVLGKKEKAANKVKNVKKFS